MGLRTITGRSGCRANFQPASVRVLAVASGGGHWVQLMQLRTAWSGADIAYLSTHPGYRADCVGSRGGASNRFYAVADANFSAKFQLVRQALAVAIVLLRERPSVVVTTGASVGYFALVFGKLMRARTVWVDSIANTEELSLSGQRVAKFADLWLTQWPEVAEGAPNGARSPRYQGSVL